MTVRIHVTRTFSDGGVIEWASETGATEADRKRRLRNAGTPFRHGQGWLEVERSLSNGTTYVDRIEWPEETA